jgi:putative DNA primase/helicase
MRSGLKKPVTTRWTERSAEPDEFSDSDLLGILLGPLSNLGHQGYSLVCVDLDFETAVARADEFLPVTGMVEGRPGKPRSHRYYLVRNSTIPPDAVSTAPGATKAAAKLGLHPGPKATSMRLRDGKVAIDFLGTGRVAVAPPSLHPSGERREWEGGVRGDPAKVDYLTLMDSVCALAKEVGCAEPKTVCKKRRRVSEKNNPQRIRAAANPDRIPLAERVRQAMQHIESIPDSELSRSGRGGHNRFFAVVSRLVHGFDLDDPLDLVKRYNERLETLNGQCPGQGYEPWSAEEIEHKIRDSLKKQPPRGKSSGWLLRQAGESSEPPMEWDNPARLAAAIAATTCYRVFGDTVYRHGPKGYRVVSELELRSELQLHAESEARSEYDRLVAARAREMKSLSTAALDELGGPDAIRRLSRLRSRRIVVPEVSQHKISAAITSLRARSKVPEGTELDTWLPDVSRPHYLSVEHGILDLQSRTLLPSSSEWFSTISIPVRYDSNAPAPLHWLKFLNEVMEGDQARIDLLQEIAGWCLDRGCAVQGFVVIAGEGANGKSVFFHVLRQLLGHGNVAAVGLDQMCSGNRFASFGLIGKLANLKGDQSFFESREESVLKELTGGDTVTFEAKYCMPLVEVNRCKLLFGCNSIPTFRDKSQGVWRRMVPVPFNWTVPVPQRDPALLTDAYWRLELPGILNWACDGLDRLRSRGRFQLPPASEGLLNRHRHDSNPARQFLEENYQTGPQDSAFVRADELYSAYRTWAAVNGLDHPLSRIAFGREIHRVFPLSVSMPRRGVFGTERVWQGIRPANQAV